MSEKSDNRRLLKRVLIIGAIVLPLAALLGWYGLRLRDEGHQRRVIAANEAAAISALDNIAAAQQLYREAHGGYATFQQLFEAGVFDAPLDGEQLVSGGYRFTVRVLPADESRGRAYEVNADPLRPGTGIGATGSRHFFAGSEVTGIRYSEGRPARATDRTLPRRADTY
jgi:hypothetical protein